MNFRLVDTAWDTELESAVRTDRSDIRIVSPFIKLGAAERLLNYGRPDGLQVITRFNLDDFAECVSDIAALRLLLENGAQIRGIRSLHAKLYLFGSQRAIVSAGNLTEAAFCRQYFDGLWQWAGSNLTVDRLDGWDRRVTEFLRRGAPPMSRSALGDEGVDAGIAYVQQASPTWVSDATQAFVKFFGEGHNRADHSMAVLDEVERSGCQWACPWPKGKRPRKPVDGAIMFMGRLVKRPKDVLIFGRAVGMRHVPGRDDATAVDVQQRPWKEHWPHYIRVHNAEFIAGNFSNAISLNELMDALKSDAFMSTQRNSADGTGNTDPRRAYMQQPAVELSPQGFAWLEDRLAYALAEHGKLPPSTMRNLDWPILPATVEILGR